MASGEASAGAAVASLPETVDLCDDDDKNAGLLGASNSDAVAPSRIPASAGGVARLVEAPTSSVIDLCNDDASPAAHYAALMAKDYSKRKRKRKRAKKSTPASGADAICIDDSKPAAARPDDPTAAYRQALGPLRMDFVDSFKAHAYQKQKQHPALKTNNLYRELLEYKLNLPIELSSSIFVRVLESRLDLIRAMITGTFAHHERNHRLLFLRRIVSRALSHSLLYTISGPEGTPYANGCFLFDMHIHDYPKKAPTVQFLTTGNGKVRFNPNLYNNGKVCLSLLGTWSGPGWQANKSTLLQVLVSIQGLILVPDPFYNEPGFLQGKHETQAKQYNKNIRKHTLEYAIDAFLQQVNEAGNQDYPEFGNVMIQHFCERADAIEEQLQEWIHQDKSIKALAERVRKNLRSVIAKYKAPPPAAAPEVVTLC